MKLIDFGIASASSRTVRTQAGVLKGKFAYMSPEQVRGLPLDRRSDLFALGTVFYESLTGERLFLGESDFSTLERVRNAEVRPPTLINSAIPQEVEKIVLRALQRNPAERYQWAAEMLDELRAFMTRRESAFTPALLGARLRELFASEHQAEPSPDGRCRSIRRPTRLRKVGQPLRAKLPIRFCTRTRGAAPESHPTMIHSPSAGAPDSGGASAAPQNLATGDGDGDGDGPAPFTTRPVFADCSFAGCRFADRSLADCRSCSPLPLCSRSSRSRSTGG